jgi:predicted permease
MKRLLRSLRRLSRSARREADLRDELQFHLDEEMDEARASGLSADQARLAARRDLGNVAIVAEDTRAAWGWTGAARLAQDLRYAIRIVRRRPAFAIAAVLTLTLGIGANTAVFSILDGLLLETLPVARPHELVQMVERRPQTGAPIDAFTYQHYESVRMGSRLLSGVAAASVYPSAQGIFEREERLTAVVHFVSDNYFEVLGVSPIRGRIFRQTPPGAAGELIAVISEAFWRSHYASDPAAVGATFRLGKREVTVAGVAPARFRGVHFERAVDIWIPYEIVVAPNSESRTRGRSVHVIGRLAPDRSLAQIDAEVTAVVGRPVSFQSAATGFSRLRQQLFQPLLLVELVVGLVLLITCVNLANLTLSGNLARERELAVRGALGASRWRIVRQLLTEHLLLALAGGALGLVVAYWISAALLSFLPATYAPALIGLRFELDGRVLVFTALLSIVTCLSVALFPALRSTRPLASNGLGVKSASGAGRPWISRSLIVGEVAMCTLLLMIAGVFLRSVQNLRGQDGGYSEEALLVADVQFPIEYGDDRRDVLIEELRARAAVLPEVEIVAYSHLGQLSGGAFEYRLGFPDRPAAADKPIAIEQRVSPGFLGAMGTRILQGRDFTAADTARSTPVAIVNELFAAEFFPGRSPIGLRFFQEGGSRGGELMEIVGVAARSKWVDLRREAPPMYYRPYSQQGGTPVVRFAIRGPRNYDGLAAAFTATAQGVDRKVELTNVVPFSEIVDRSILVERLVAQVSGAFGVLALVIAAVGLYGVLAYAVTRRRREIGVRIAIGASPGSVERMFLRESFLQLAVGLAIGVPAAILVIRYVSSMLYGLTPYDPTAIVAVTVVLAAATAAAAYLPARRASSTDPIVALRDE